MAPPSQAGKFKPTKKPKKIRPGSSTGAPVPPPVPSSSATTAAAAAAVGGSGSARPTSRPRSQRGGARDPIQQGPSFFTANPAPATKSSGAASFARSDGGGGTTSYLQRAVKERVRAAAVAGKGDKGGSSEGGERGGSLIKRERQGNAASEEIVGMLDVGIGGSQPAPGPEKVSSSKVRSGLEKGGSSGAGKKLGKQEEEELAPPPASAFEYDSDSSMELDAISARLPPGLSMPSKNPLTLPFPKSKFPPGVGAPIELSDKNAEKKAAELDVSASPTTTTATSPVSPFVDLASTEDLEDATESLFLLQFPTRLPPLAGAAPVITEGATTRTAVAAADAVDTTIAEVATPPVRKECFDNSLATATPGRIGKFVVYQSGKTVLILHGQDGREYSLNVTEGLSCGFRQQAVIIDDDTKEFVPLGDVCKTAVITPDLSSS